MSRSEVATMLCLRGSLVVKVAWNNLPKGSRKPNCLLFLSWADQSHDLCKILVHRSQSWWEKEKKKKKKLPSWSWAAVSPIIFNPSKEGWLFFLSDCSYPLSERNTCSCTSWSSLFPYPLQVSPVPFSGDFWPFLLTSLQHLINLGAFLIAQATAEQPVLTQKNQRVWVDPVLHLVGQAARVVETGGELLVEHCVYPLSSHLLLLTLRDLEGKPEEEGQSSLPNRETAC